MVPSNSRLLSEARICRSLYARLQSGIPVEGMRTCGECSRRSVPLFRTLLRRASGRGATVERLRLLSEAYDLLCGTTTVADFSLSDLWYSVAEDVMAPCLGEASPADGLLLTGLCRCLTDYFYQSPVSFDDGWYRYLRDTADAWAAGFIGGDGWRGVGLAEAMERTEVLNRLSYMFLDRSRDSVIGGAYARCASRLSSLPVVPSGLWERWFLLCTEGHACPLDAEGAFRAAGELYRRGSSCPEGSDGRLLGDSYRLAAEAWRLAFLSAPAV